MNRTDWEPSAKNARRQRVQTPRLAPGWPRPAQLVSSNTDAGPPEVPGVGLAGADGVALDESRIWKSYGGMWQVKPATSGL